MHVGIFAYSVVCYLLFCGMLAYPKNELVDFLRKACATPRANAYRKKRVLFRVLVRICCFKETVWGVSVFLAKGDATVGAKCHVFDS